MTFKVKYTYLAITYGRPFVSKLWHDIRAVFSHVYLQSFLLHDIRAFFLPRILAFFPALWGFYSQVYDHFFTNAHICAHKKAHIYAFVLCLVHSFVRLWKIIIFVQIHSSIQELQNEYNVSKKIWIQSFCGVGGSGSGKLLFISGGAKMELFQSHMTLV